MSQGLIPGADQRQIAVEGVRFAVQVGGPKKPPAESTPVLLLHGVPQTAVAFRHLLPELGRDRRVIAPDLKGLGESEVVGRYDVPGLVRELAALVLHECDGPVDVVGHDWGGALAIALANARPELVRKLVVVNAPYRHINFLRAWYIPVFLLPGVPELGFRIGGRRLIARIFSWLWHSDNVLDRVSLVHYQRCYTDPARIRAMLGYYRDNFRDRIPRMLVRRGGDRRPIVEAGERLVVWGAADPVLALPIAETVVRDLGPDTRLVTLPGVGHFPLEEAPEVVVPLTAEFLRGSAEPLPVAAAARGAASVGLGMPAAAPPQ